MAEDASPLPQTTHQNSQFRVGNLWMSRKKRVRLTPKQNVICNRPRRNKSYSSAFTLRITIFTKRCSVHDTC